MHFWVANHSAHRWALPGQSLRLLAASIHFPAKSPTCLNVLRRWLFPEITRDILLQITIFFGRILIFAEYQNQITNGSLSQPPIPFYAAASGISGALMTERELGQLIWTRDGSLHPGRELRRIDGGVNCHNNTLLTVVYIIGPSLLKLRHKEYRAPGRWQYLQSNLITNRKDYQ